MQQPRKWLGFCLAAVAVLATACPSPPGGGGPSWSAIGAGGPESGGVTPLVQAIGTTDDWYVEMAFNDGTQPDGLSFYPRQGLNGNDLGVPQTFASATFELDAGELSDHLYVSEDQQLDNRVLQFYRESGGTWATAGTMLLSIYQNVMALTDDTMAVLTVDPAENDPSVIELFDLTIVGGDVVATPNSALTAPPGWGSGYETTYGKSSVDLEGDVLAVSAGHYGGGAPYQVGVYRRVGGIWQLDEEMVGGPDQLTAYVAVDDMGSTERLAIGATASTGTGVVDLYMSDGSGWSLEDQLSPPTGVIDDDGGKSFGYGVTLDGNLLVTGLAREILPPLPDFPHRAIYHHSVFHLDGGVWSYEARLTATNGPVDPTDVVIGTTLPHLSSNHVVGSSLISTTACTSPCVSFRMESWRFDRTPLP